MPSHIFTRVGQWADSISSNLASARVAKADKEPDDQLHAIDYVVYAYLQLGEDKKALAAIQEMQTITGVNAARLTGPFALAASAARYALERQDWAAAAALRAATTRFPQADAITHFARALGAARLGDIAGAEAEIAKLASLRDKLAAAQDAYWAQQVDIQTQIAAAWVLYANRSYDAALLAMKAAAEAEDATEKHVVTPGPLLPARELYGHMLNERGKHDDALIAFETSLKKERNRLGATIGAGKAAEKKGDLALARQYYAKAIEQAGTGEAASPDLAHARNFLVKTR
jgi:tetratricopeptide (TPR) repeat protein